MNKKQKKEILDELQGQLIKMNQSSVQPLQRIMVEIRDAQKEGKKLNEDYRERLDEHIHIYENNGLEMKRLADAVESMVKKQNTMYKVYQGFNWSTKAVMWILGLIATILGIVLTVKEIFGK